MALFSNKDLRSIEEGSSSEITPSSTAQQEQKNNYNAKKNEGQLKNVFHYCFLGILVIGFALLAVILVIRIWHLVMPECYQWLDLDQLQTLDKLLFSGALGGILGRHLNKILD